MKTSAIVLIAAFSLCALACSKDDYPSPCRTNTPCAETNEVDNLSTGRPSREQMRRLGDTLRDEPVYAKEPVTIRVPAVRD